MSSAGTGLARNTVWNFLGQLLPIMVALLAVPRLVHTLGTERFGILTLAWMVTGYFSLFDLGLGRALTKIVSEKLGTGATQDLLDFVREGMLAMAAMGVVGGTIAWFVTPTLVQSVLKVPLGLRSETVLIFKLLSLSLPFIIVNAGFSGVLEGLQRFDVTNAIRIPMGAYTYLAPLALLPFTHRLLYIVAALVVGRVIACGASTIACFRVLPHLRVKSPVRGKAIVPLLSFGTWMTVSNIVGPVLVYLDRFLIGALISMSAVAYYATPYEAITRLWFVPAAFSGVLFPAFSALSAEPTRLSRLFGRGLKYVGIALFPAILIACTLASDGLRIWLGPEFSSHSTRVLQLLAGGVFINSMAQVAFALLQSQGRPDITAKLHLIELLPYAGAVWFLVHRFGVTGAAFAWTARVVVDAMLLFWYSARHVPALRATILRALAFVAAASVLFAFGSSLHSAVFKAGFLLIAAVTYVVCAWGYLFSNEERAWITGVAQRYVRLAQTS